MEDLTSLENNNVAATALAVAAADKKPKLELQPPQDEDKEEEERMAHLLEGMQFVVYGTSESSQQVRAMVFSMGGEIVEPGTTGALALVGNMGDVEHAHNRYNVFLYDLIYNIQRNGCLPDFKHFRVGKPPSLPGNCKLNVGEAMLQDMEGDSLGEKLERTQAAISSQMTFLTPKKKSAKFTVEEDEAIVDLIRRNPYLRSTHSFYSQIAQLPLLKRHTGNSIRFRYRKILQKRLDWVYKVDPDTNEMQLDPQTHQPIKLKQLTGLLKSQYTAQEDYDLCQAVVQYRAEKVRAAAAAAAAAAASGGNGTGAAGPHRTGKSVPETVFQGLFDINPRHTTMSWRDRYRKFASVFGPQKYIEYYDECIAKGETPSAMRNLSSRGQVGRRPTTRSILEAVEKRKREEDGTGGQPSPKARKLKLAKDGTAAAEQSANLFEDADEMRALNIDFTGSLNASGALLLGNITFEALKSAEPEPLANRSAADPNEVLKDIEELFGEFGSQIRTTEDLFKAIHAKTGISAAWLGYWFDCSCGMFNVFLDAVQNYLRTGDLVLKEHAGFWTEEQDRMLSDKSKLEDLYRIHGKESVEKRIATVGSQTEE